jgi:hypothetical protein
MFALKTHVMKLEIRVEKPNRISFDFVGLTKIDEWIEDFKELKEKGVTHIHFDFEDITFDTFEIRQETDDEYCKRIVTEDRAKAIRQSKDYQEYLRLKDIFNPQ